MIRSHPVICGSEPGFNQEHKSFNPFLFYFGALGDADNTFSVSVKIAMITREKKSEEKV